MGQEKRKNPRKHMRYSAWLQAATGKPPISCSMSDVSHTGARLDVDTVNALPDRFILLLSESGHPRRLCRVVWRSETQVGVEFEKAAELGGQRRA